MQDRLIEIIDKLKGLNVDYADARYVKKESLQINVHNKTGESTKSDTDEGIGIRVLKNGAWGFAATSNINSMDELIFTLKKAVEIAEAASLTRKEPIKIADAEGILGEYRTDYKIDPFSVSKKDILDLLRSCMINMTKINKIKIAYAGVDFQKTTKIFVNTDGTLLRQFFVETGGDIGCIALSDSGEVQRRTFGNFAQKGYEFIDELNLLQNSERIAIEAEDLLKADICPEGEFDLIIGSAQMALQVHESCGHPTELDRVFGSEISFAGGSFLDPSKLNNYRYGSEIVNIVADATFPHGLGTFGYDDEGTPAQRIDLIKDGVLVGYLSSRETAWKLGLQSSGAMRAESWNRLPLIRMVNINLEPVEGTLDDLISSTDRGIFVDVNKSWSIDDLRLNFQFGCEYGYEIKNGKLGRLLKNPTYTGITPHFWRSCDAICGEKEQILWGLPTCGKGEPVQLMHVGHATVPARFRKVKVFGSK